MRSSFTVQTGLKLARTPNVREQATRRRLAVVGAVLGLALLSGLFGVLTHGAGGGPPNGATGPFSYFPSE